jgi:hypothetical protein
MSSRTKPAPAKPKGTPVKPSTPKIIGWTPSGGLMPIYYSKPKGPRPIAKGGKKSKMRSSRRRRHRQNRTQRRN